MTSANSIKLLSSHVSTCSLFIVMFLIIYFCYLSNFIIFLLRSKFLLIVFLYFKRNHKAQRYSNADIRTLAGLSNIRYTNEVLNNILIPRVVGTPNHDKVFEYIKRELTKLNWTVEVDEFEDKTPRFGVLKFLNIIASLNPDADRYLVLACHYDSKYFENEEFVGEYKIVVILKTTPTNCLHSFAVPYFLCLSFCG